MRDRRGFTLIETLIALILLQLGVAALVATAGTMARDLAEAAARRRAHAAARNRVDVIRSAACTSAVSGSARLEAGMEESWRVETRGAGRLVVDSVAVPLGRGRRAFAVSRGWIVCRR